MLTEHRKKLSFKQNLSWVFLGNLIYALFQWLILLSIAKYLTPKDLGIYGIGLAITVPIVMFLNLQLRSIQATDHKDEFSFNNYFGLKLILILIGFFVILVLSLISADNSQIRNTVLIVGLFKLVDSLSEVTYGQFQKKQIMNYIGISKTLKSVIGFIFFIIVLIFTNNLNLSLLVYSFIFFFFFIFFDLIIIRRLGESIKPSINMGKAFFLITSALPLGIVTLLGSLNTNTPRYIIEHYLGTEELGFFLAFTSIIVAGNTFVSALGQASISTLSEKYLSKDIQGFIKNTIKLSGIGFCVGLIAFLITFTFPEELLRIIFDKEYVKYSNEFLIVMFSGVILYTGAFLNYATISTRRHRSQPITGLIWVITTFIAGIMLIPTYGVLGASVTSVVSASIILITRVINLIYLIRSI